MDAGNGIVLLWFFSNSWLPDSEALRMLAADNGGAKFYERAVKKKELRLPGRHASTWQPTLNFNVAAQCSEAISYLRPAD
jgi:hypothetical protein